MDDIFKQTFRVNGEVVSRSIAGETFLIPIRGRLADMQCIFAINPVAEYIWSQLDGEKSLEQVKELVVESFDVERTEADADIKEFVEELLRAGLIKGSV